MVARLWFVGDVHLGRRPARLPRDLADHGVQTSDLTPIAAWRVCVDRAIECGVDALILAGDVVDGIDDRFEAYAHLKRGVERLVEAGVPVYGVAGNHDVEALPRLARQIPEFGLLGEGGRWQTVRVATADGAHVRLVGWSFPELRVRQDPLAQLSLDPEPGIATIGVLHCDMDARRSVYAPVSRAALDAAPVDAWMLGHIHQPSSLESERPIGYLGSLSPVASGELGARGPWLVEVEGPGVVRARQIPLAPLRWEQVDIDAAGLDAHLAADAESAFDVDHQDDAVFAKLCQALVSAREAAAGAAARAVGCRVRWVGQSRYGKAIERARLDETRWPRETWEGSHYFVSEFIDDSAPALDLVALARNQDPLGLMARRVLALERGGEEADRLTCAAMESLQATSSAPRWARTGGARSKPEAVRDMLLRAGRRTLTMLAAQRDTAGPPS